MNVSLEAPTSGMHWATGLVCILIVGLLSFVSLTAQGRHGPNPTAAPIGESQDEPKIPNDQLDALVAPIALYPDPLLGQVLVASTYPLEVMQLQQWLTTKGSGIDQNAIMAEVQQLDFDPSIQAMAILPEVLKEMADHISWTQDLGNAFLAQQNDVLDAVQRMRVKARDNGMLKSGEHMNVDTRLVESETAVVIEQTNPDVVYVPSYNPEAVWGVIVYPYPPFYYPPFGYFGVGVIIGFRPGISVGTAWGGGWGWSCGWGSKNININLNNSFVRSSSMSGRDGTNLSGNTWQHNPRHRGGAPYSNRGVANKYGGALRGGSGAGAVAGSRLGGAGGERIGSRDVSGGPGASNRGTWGDGSSFGGGSMDGSAVRSSGSRGASSIGGSMGGGVRGGGGMRGGGRRR